MRKSVKEKYIAALARKKNNSRAHSVRNFPESFKFFFFAGCLLGFDAGEGESGIAIFFMLF